MPFQKCQCIRVTVTTTTTTIIITFIESWMTISPSLNFIIFLDRGEGREKESKRNIDVLLPLTHPLLGIWPHNPGMCPDWELNLLQAGIQSTEPHQPGLRCKTSYVGMVNSGDWVTCLWQGKERKEGRKEGGKRRREKERNKSEKKENSQPTAWLPEKNEGVCRKERVKEG